MTAAPANASRLPWCRHPGGPDTDHGRLLVQSPDQPGTGTGTGTTTIVF